MKVFRLKDMVSSNSKKTSCSGCGDSITVFAGYTGRFPKCQDCRIDLGVKNNIAYSEHANFTVLNAAKVTQGGRII